MLPDQVSNPEPLTYESGALPTALRGLATGPLTGKPVFSTCIMKKKCGKQVELYPDTLRPFSFDMQQGEARHMY